MTSTAHDPPAPHSARDVNSSHPLQLQAPQRPPEHPRRLRPAPPPPSPPPGAFPLHALRRGPRSADHGSGWVRPATATDTANGTPRQRPRHTTAIGTHSPAKKRPAKGVRFAHARAGSTPPAPPYYLFWFESHQAKNEVPYSLFWFECNGAKIGVRSIEAASPPGSRPTEFVQ